MPRHSPGRSFRVAAMLDLTWNLKRHTDIFAGVVRYAQKHEDWQCVIDDFADDTLVEHNRRNRPYDGIIGRVTPKLAAQARRCRVPLVNVWISSPETNLVSVISDAGKVGELYADHMLKRGVRRFLCLLRRGDVGEKTMGKRFANIVREAGCECDVQRVPVLFAHSRAQWSKTLAQIEDWFQRTPMPAGVLAGIDLLARHVAQLCGSWGLDVPQDVAIAGGYNEEPLCLHPEPSLTSIEYGLDHLGHEAARVLHEMLLGQKPARKTVLIPPRELVVRQSSDFVYVDEETVSAAMRYIAQNVRGGISVDDVASAVTTSRRTLEQRFERHLGRSVGAEIRRVRIDHAKRLIASCDMTFSQIAPSVGFGTAQYMARVFQREVGVSPREYRSQIVDNE